MSVVKNEYKKVIGQSNQSISIGDKGVVTKMKNKKLSISYVSKQKPYTPQELKDLDKTENDLYKYLLSLDTVQRALKS